MPDSGTVFPPTGRVVDASIAAVAGGTITFYSAGTTTPLTVYSDSTLSTSLGSVVYLDSAGHPVASSGSSTKVLVYTGAALIKMVVKDSGGSTVESYDNVRCAQDTSSFSSSSTGSGIQGIKSKTADYFITADDDGYIINCDPTGAAFTIVLLSAVTATDGFTIYIKHAGTTTTNPVLIKTTSSQNISGSGTTLTATALTGGGETLTLVSNGAAWDIVSRVPPRLSWQMPIPVVSRLSTPPTSPNAGAFYIVTASPSGAWASYAQHDLARANGQGGWIKYTPPTDCGWIAYIQGENVYTTFQDSAWVDATGLVTPAVTSSTYDVAHTAATTTAAGNLAAGAWTKRTLNTVVTANITGASLATSNITLPAGTYRAHIVQSFYAAGGTSSTQNVASRLINVTTSSVLLTAPSVTVIQDAGDKKSGGTTVIVGEFTLAAASALEVQNRSDGTVTLGATISIAATNEVFATAQFSTIGQGPQGSTGATGTVDSAYVALTLANGSNNNVVLGNGNVFRVTGPSAGFTITGIASGTDGKLVEILNYTGQNMTIANSSASSSAGNKIDTLTGSDVTTTGNGCVRLRYSSTDSIWVVAGGVQS